MKPRVRLVERVRKVVIRTAAVKGAGIVARSPVKTTTVTVAPVRGVARGPRAKALPAPREVLMLPAEQVKVLPRPKR